MQVKQDSAMADKQTQARNLAALEAAIAQELTTSRTMTLAVGSAPDSGRLTPTVEAWLHDWQDYHAGHEANPILKACLPVAINQVSPQRIAAAVWHLTRQEWNASTEATTPHTKPHTPAPQEAARVVVAPGSKFARAEIMVDGEPITVAGCVADVLRRLGNGENRLRLRPETIRKLREALPWVAAMLRRDHDAKVISNQHVYHADGHAVELIRVSDRVPGQQKAS